MAYSATVRAQDISEANRSSTVRFDAAAAAWDSVPNASHEVARLFYNLICENNLVNVDHNVLELGCGTGLLTVPLSSRTKDIYAVDLSIGMLDQLKQKLEQNVGLSNIHPMCIELTKTSDLPAAAQPLHRIVSALMFHHVPNPPKLLKLMCELLAPGGWVHLVDIQLTDVSMLFHPPNVHVECHGFDLVDFGRLLREAGFVDVAVSTAFSIDKDVSALHRSIEHSERPLHMPHRMMIASARKPVAAL